MSKDRLELSGPQAIVDRLLEATNRHDLEEIGECFALDFANDTPLHPARSFRGREQVKRNWAQILNGVPDIEARILARALDGDRVWTEWEMSGTRRDGARHLMRGVMVFAVEAGFIRSLRFYLEPVDESSVGVDAAVSQTVGR
jgi:ketosteroid isomerase-like protein